jgi:hypothetical protein
MKKMVPCLVISKIALRIYAVAASREPPDSVFEAKYQKFSANMT